MARARASRGSVVRVDNSIDWERRLEYRERHAGWEVFRYLYWGIYIFVIGCMLIIGGFEQVNLMLFAGWATILLAIFLVIYGFVVSLHHRLMRRHG